VLSNVATELFGAVLEPKENTRKTKENMLKGIYAK